MDDVWEFCENGVELPAGSDAMSLDADGLNGDALSCVRNAVWGVASRDCRACSTLAAAYDRRVRIWTDNWVLQMSCRFLNEHVNTLPVQSYSHKLMSPCSSNAVA